MVQTDPVAEISDLRLVLRTAIAHARHRLAKWIDPEGISEDECLTELTQLLFHPAIDVVTSLRPSSNDENLQILWQAVSDSREILRRYSGPKAYLQSDECLEALLGVLDNRRLMNAGDLRRMFTVVQWGPAYPRRRQPLAWCIRRALGADATERVYIDVSG